MKKKYIIVFENNEVLVSHILSKLDVNILLLYEKKSKFYIVNKILRLYLFLNFTYLIFFKGSTLVISAIANSQLISKLIKIFPFVNFISIQHYIFIEAEINNLKYLNQGKFYCFGRQQSKLIENRFKFQSNIEYIGSPIYSIYRRNNKKILNPKIKICYISQWTPSNLIKFERNQKSDYYLYSIRKIEVFLKKYLKKYNYNYVIALREREKGKEFSHFKSIFNEKNLKIRKDLFNTYKLIDNSEVIISWCSTCAAEAFADNKKVLFIPFKDNHSIVTKNNICLLKNINFEIFEKKLNYLLELSPQKFKNLTFKDQNLIISRKNIYIADKIIQSKISELIK